jgi:hypothetical protein
MDKTAYIFFWILLIMSTIDYIYFSVKIHKLNERITTLENSQPITQEK